MFGDAYRVEPHLLCSLDHLLGLDNGIAPQSRMNVHIDLKHLITRSGNIEESKAND
jgi:hypothetical protein